MAWLAVLRRHPVQPGNPWWDDFGAMNQYVERVQSVLQSGRADNDILVYWPVFDIWDSPEGMTQQLGVHDVKWLVDTSAGRLARTLMARGYSFDYISDAQLAHTRTVDGELATPGARYKILVVPASRRMPSQLSNRWSGSRKVVPPCSSNRCRKTYPGMGSWRNAAHGFARCWTPSHSVRRRTSIARRSVEDECCAEMCSQCYLPCPSFARPSRTPAWGSFAGPTPMATTISLPISPRCRSSDG